VCTCAPGEVKAISAGELYPALPSMLLLQISDVEAIIRVLALASAGDECVPRWVVVNTGAGVLCCCGVGCLAGVPRRQPHRRSGLATLPSFVACPSVL